MEISVNSASCYKNDNLIFRDINLTLKNSDIALISGSNGSGKTTLIKSICGIQALESGNVSINDVDIENKNSTYIENIIYVGHKNSLNNDLTVYENLEYLSALDLSINSNNKLKIEEAMNYFNIYKYKDYPVKNLSEGNKKKTSLARLVMTKKKIWVLDEPLSFLDDKSTDIFINLMIKNQKNQGITILSSHIDLSKNIENMKHLRM
tara:strand:+ start:526 stop:1146 length:621 start_codon:yes stop_codon:yes gene_type:complete